MQARPFTPLAPGDAVALLAPAGPLPAPEVEAASALVEARGYRCRVYPSCGASDRYLAGSDALRAADLNAAFHDDEVRAIFCLRGGYGSGRLLDRLEPVPAAASSKPLIGYSDLTAVHAWLGRQGCIGLHAPMPGSDLIRPQREADADALFALLAGGWVEGVELQGGADDALRVAGQAQGRLLGGNLSVFASLVGTRWQADCQGALLFLEEVAEPPYRVDRLLWQLREAGVLAAAAGFVLGSFNGAEPCADVLAEYLLPLGKPLLSGWPAGHCSPHRALPLGARMRLDAERGVLTLLQTVIRRPEGCHGAA